MTHDDETVERVATSIRCALYDEQLARHLVSGDFVAVSKAMDAAARAALSAMPPPELRIGAFVLRSAPNGIWIGRDGEGGEFATEHVERVIAQFYRENF